LKILASGVHKNSDHFRVEVSQHKRDENFKPLIKIEQMAFFAFYSPLIKVGVCLWPEFSVSKVPTQVEQGAQLNVIKLG
jgi:hypothetical protein